MLERKLLATVLIISALMLPFIPLVGSLYFIRELQLGRTHDWLTIFAALITLFITSMLAIMFLREAIKEFKGENEKTPTQTGFSRNRRC